MSSIEIRDKCKQNKCPNRKKNRNCQDDREDKAQRGPIKDPDYKDCHTGNIQNLTSLTYGGTELKDATDESTNLINKLKHHKITDVFVFYSKTYDKGKDHIEKPLILSLKYGRNKYHWYENTGNNITWKKFNGKNFYGGNSRPTEKFIKKLNGLTCQFFHPAIIDVTKPGDYDNPYCKANPHKESHDKIQVQDYSDSVPPGYRAFGHTYGGEPFIVTSFKNGPSPGNGLDENELPIWDVARVIVYFSSCDVTNTPLLLHVCSQNGATRTWYKNSCQSGEWKEEEDRLGGKDPKAASSNGTLQSILEEIKEKLQLSCKEEKKEVEIQQELRSEENTVEPGQKAKAKVQPQQPPVPPPPPLPLPGGRSGSNGSTQPSEEAKKDDPKNNQGLTATDDHSAGVPTTTHPTIVKTSGKAREGLSGDNGQNCHNDAVAFNITSSRSGYLLNDFKPTCIRDYRKIEFVGGLKHLAGTNYVSKTHRITDESGKDATISRLTLNGRPINMNLARDYVATEIRLVSSLVNPKVPIMFELKPPDNGVSRWFYSQDKDGTSWGEDGSGDRFYSDDGQLSGNLSNKLDGFICKYHKGVTIDLSHSNSTSKRSYCCNGSHGKRISVQEISVNHAHQSPSVTAYSHSITSPGLKLAGIYYKDGSNRNKITLLGVPFPIIIPVDVYVFYCFENPVLIYLDYDGRHEATGWYKKQNGSDDSRPWTKLTGVLPGVIPTNFNSLTCEQWNAFVDALKSAGCHHHSRCTGISPPGQQGEVPKESPQEATAALTDGGASIFAILTGIGTYGGTLAGSAATFFAGWKLYNRYKGDPWVDYESMSKVKGEKLWIIGNLPFYITSQILFCLVDYKSSIDRAVVTAQLEVAKRIVANPGDTDYSILSVVLQLYATPKLLFTIPNYAFYPKPKVHSGVISLAFDPEKQPKCAPLILKRILKDSFGQRRKKLKTSLSQFLEQQEIKSLPHPLPDMRPQQLSPNEFESLALWIEKNGNFTATPKSYKLSDNRRLRTRMGPEALEISPRIWRQEKHGE